MCYPYYFVRVMDMSLEDTLTVLGLDDEANVFPSTGGEGGGHFFNISRGRSGNCREDSRLTPGHTPFALGTHGSYMDTVRGALLALQVGDLGHHVVTLVPCWVG